MSSASPADYQATVAQAAASLRDGRLSVLAGAGISIGRASNLPGWSDLVYAMLDALRPSSPTKAREAFADSEGLLLNEVILKVLDESLGRTATILALRACFGTSAFSAIHHCLAKMAMEYGTNVVTTNYDKLIEASLPTANVGEKIIHAHGTLEDPDEMRFTESNVFGQLPSQLRERVQEAAAGRCLLVCGYRGADEFDVMPAIFHSEEPPRTVIWVYHREEPDAQVLAWMKGTTSYVIGADVDQFLADLWRNLHPSDRGAATLGDMFSATESPNPPDWWRHAIAGWGKERIQSDGNAVALAWPTILEQFAARTPKAAAPIISAYEQVLADWSESPDSDAIHERMLPWLAIAKRIGSEDLRAATERLRHSREGTGNSETRRHLAMRLGAILHEYGRVLNGEGRFKESDQALMEAWKVRSSAHDPQAAYSVFQVFMHARARYAASDGQGVLRLPFDFPTLAAELKAGREVFLKDGEPRHASTMMHNQAFMMEFRGKNQLEIEPEDDGVSLVKSARGLYREAASVRQNLRAPQLSHRSLLRLAECELWLFQHDANMSDDDRLNALARARACLSELEDEGDVDPQIRGELGRIHDEYDSLLNDDP